MTNRSSANLLWFEEIGMQDVPLVGGKNASLGEMTRSLGSKGIRVPNGFATTSKAFRDFISAANLGPALRDALSGRHPDDVEALQSSGQRARDLILAAQLPAQLTTEIEAAYDRLCAEYGPDTDVAVRSSATAEDLPEASFAGQQETFLNVRGKQDLLEACRACFASLFNDRAIHYREERGFDHFSIALSVGVQKMVRTDAGCSGVMFTIDTETGFPDVVLINSSYGLGESIVQGSVNPDEYLVFKPTLLTGHSPILRRRLGTKEIKLVYSQAGGKQTEMVSVPAEQQILHSLHDDEVLELARWACQIEQHYTSLRGSACPMDIEWALEENTRTLFILQARPETVRSRESGAILRTFSLKASGPVLAKGRAVGDGIAVGKARLIQNAAQMSQLIPGEVLVTNKTDPDWEPIMKKASAIVTNQGGRTCHAAIVAREIGIPAIVGTEHGTSQIASGQAVTVSCAEGDDGHVYEGELPFEVLESRMDEIRPLRTELMMNLAQPGDAFRLSSLPNDGIGLARIEFIIASGIQIHPLALVHPDRVSDPSARTKIAELTASYADKTDYFVEKLAEGVGAICAAFYPKPVIVRLSDFKTNEYATLIGGADFEPPEENPMIGWRGASRYYDPDYREGFALECRALKSVRDRMGLTNLIAMIPFCRTIAEGEAVLAEMAANGFARGDNGLEVYVMCEIPSNAILADEFAKIFDGFSIGSNDLTQLVLGVDRDSARISRLFDERDPAVLKTIAMVIEAARRNNRKIGICGQAPSDFPDFASYLVKLGINSISLNPDSLLKIRSVIASAEESL